MIHESAKAFEQAIRVDPNCAMCYWGLAEAVGMRGDEADVVREEGAGEGDGVEGACGAAGKLYIEAAEVRSEEKGGDRSKKIAICGNW
jgi:hypothetical protein